MDKLLDRLSIGVILRHLICGGVFTLSAAYAYSGDVASTMKHLSENGVPAAIIALISGTLIYGIHRATVNPIAEAVRTYRFGNWLKQKLFPSKCVSALKGRWEQRKKAVKDDHEKETVIADHIEAWADYVHLLYTSGLAIWLGSLSVWLRWKREDIDWDWRVIAIGGGLMLAGFINDVRKQVSEELYY